MVLRLLTLALLLATAPVAVAQPLQLCLSCHPAHYAGRGRCSDCHYGNPASDRNNIAHAALRAGKYVRYTLGEPEFLKKGEGVFDRLACRRCHVGGGRGNRLAVSLDDTAVRKKAGEILVSIRRPVKNMPDFSLDDEWAALLVNVIFAGPQGRETDEAAPVKVHFNVPGKKTPDIFSKKCGSCHRMLSERLGAVGTGNIGPNLSGLFTEFYPKTFRNNGIWTVSNLNLWLQNPRKIKVGARMQPVPLTGAEAKDLEPIILVSPEATK